MTGGYRWIRGKSTARRGKNHPWGRSICSNNRAERANGEGRRGALSPHWERLDVALFTTSTLPPGRALMEVPLFADELIFLAGKPIERPWRLAFRRESKEAALCLGAALRYAPPRAPA